MQITNVKDQLVQHRVEIDGWTTNCSILPINTHTHTQPFNGLCPGLPGWASIGRNSRLLTPILIIRHPLSTSSIYYDPLHPPCSIYMLDSPFPQLSPGPLWSTSWFGTLYFIHHTSLHPIVFFFLQHMPTPLQPVLLQFRDYVINS